MVKQLYLCLQSRWVDLKDVWVRGVRQDQGKVQVSLSWLPVTADRWVTSTSTRLGYSDMSLYGQGDHQKRHQDSRQ